MRTLDPTRGDHILEAAACLFHKRRYHEVRMDDVASQAGVAKGTLYRYFQDKEALYLALILSSMNRFIADVEPLMAESQPAAERLRIYVRRSAAFCERYPYFLDLVQRVEGTDDPERLAPLQEARQKLLAIVTEVIQQLDGTGRFRIPHPALAAIAFVGIIRQTFRFLPQPWPADLPDLLADQFLFGVCPPAAVR